MVLPDHQDTADTWWNAPGLVIAGTEHLTRLSLQLVLA